MSSIPLTSGVYILVFYLSQRADITFNRKNSRHSSPPGWYLYVGSVYGSGGLNRRLGRHQRQHNTGKRLHWNVDYFREHSTLCEIWHCETADVEVEHQWSRILNELIGGTVPVPKFGASDGEAHCPSHFFYFLNRPLTATFRAKLSSRDLATKVIVEFIEEPPRSRQSAPGLHCEYLLGRRFLKLRRRSIDETCLKPCQWVSLAKRRPAKATC